MSTEVDLDAEIETLTSMLKNASDKIGFWVDNEHKKLLSNLVNQQDEYLQKADEEKDRLTNMVNNIKLEEHKVLGEKQYAMQKLKSDLEVQKKVVPTLQEKKTKYETEIVALEKNNEKLKQDIEGTSKEKEKLEYLTKAGSVFSNMLGLSLRKTRGNKIQVIFTQIDEKDPTMMCYFFLQIVNRKYIVSNPDPKIEGLDELVDKLNDTNNLRQFVINVRKKFKDLVKS